MDLNILAFDIETAPIDARVWGLWKQNVGLKQIVEDWHVLCWCAKWVGSNEVMTCALPDFDTYKDDPRNDIHVLNTLYELLDKADIVIAHNGDGFDLPKVNARLIIQGFTPYSPVRSIDTLKTARRVFGFTSNKLDYIANALGVGQKIDTGGFELWNGCLDGDKKSWAKMVDYCAHDTTLLEGVYLKTRAWDNRHPNLGLYVDDTRAGKVLCPVCGSDNIRKDGTRTHKTNMSKFQRYHCNNCHSWPRGRKNLADRTNLLANSGG